MGKVRVLIVDDTTLVRQGIRSLLESQEAIEAVGEAASGQEATELAQELSPDVILLDQDMPGLDTIHAIRVIKQRRPEAEVIILAEWADEDKTFQAIEAGAAGYLLKDIDAENLFGAIQEVCNGRTLMQPRIARQLVDKFRALMRERSNKNGANAGVLTNRELEILLEMTKGTTDREIAGKLALSATTVKSHTRSIFRKLGVRNRTHAVACMLQSGTIRSPESGGFVRSSGDGRSDEGGRDA